MSVAAAARPGWVRTAATSIVVGFLTAGSLFTGMVGLAPAAHAATMPASSAVTATAQQQDPDAAGAPFPNLSVTVSQTQGLVNQGIRLTYAGGSQSTYFSQQDAGKDFLQIMECWGDLKDPATGQPVLDKNGQPQPDRTTCQFGSINIGQGQTRDATYQLDADGNPLNLDPEDRQYLDPGAGVLVPPQVSIPFASVTGKTLARIVNGKVVANAPDLTNNEFFGTYSTNEVPWAGFGADGTGSATFEVQTAMQAPGLGCGNPVTVNGTLTGQPCWLVVVPRGTHDLNDISNIGNPLLYQTWKHRLAVRLDFQPLGVRCPLGAAERQLSGSELVSRAIQAWQPVLCNQQGGSIYNVVTASDSDAATKANGTGTAPLALVSRPLDGAAVGMTDDLTYAPIAVTGLTVAFSVDHKSDPFSAVTDDVKALDRTPFTQMNLTPRLVAKLLTNSYVASLPTGAKVPYLATNPQNITQDPDFLDVNPGWKSQAIDSPALADVFVPLGHSDSAWAIWSYVMSDASARDFLAGKPDPYGMVVNPWATTSADWDASVNPPGIAAEYPTDRFLKPDPTEVQMSDSKSSIADGITWRPYSLNFDQSAYWVLRGDARTVSWTNGVSGGGTGIAQFIVNPRDTPGRQKVMGLTDTAAAARYQVYTASLRNPAGNFVAPTTASMAAAADAMTPVGAQPQVSSFDPTSAAAKAATDAYPLTLPVYAATNPAGGDAASRAAAAAFITYAAQGGQTPGNDLGQLPPGYAPIPDAWRTRALSAAATIAAGPAPEPTAEPTPAPTDGTSPGSGVPSGLPSAPVSGLPVGGVPTGPAESSAPTPSPGGPTPGPTPTGPPPPVLGAGAPADTGSGALGAAIPISAGGGLLAALVVPLLARPRRIP